MTTLVSGLTSAEDCLPQYALSDDMICSGRAKGLEMTRTGTSVTIQPGLAYVPVEDSVGRSFNLKVYIDSAITIASGSNEDIIIRVSPTNIDNPVNNNDLTDIAIIESVASGTGGDFHLVLATTNSSGTISEINNAGQFLPGCDFCMKCEGGVLQLPDINAGEIDSDGITNTGNISTTGDLSVGDDLTVTDNTTIGGDLDVSGVISGDGSGLTNVPSAGISYMTETTPGLAEIATQSEYDTKTNTTRVPTIKQIWESMPRTPADDITRLSISYFGTISQSYVSAGSFISKTGGVYRVSYTFRATSGGDAYIDVNGFQQLLTHTSGTETILGYINVGRGDTVNVFIKASSSTPGASISNLSITSD